MGKSKMLSFNGMSFLRNFWLGLVSEEINSKKIEAKLPTSFESVESISLGEMCVVGDESAGKSWTLRRLTQLGIFDVGQNVVTRLVCRLKLRFSATTTTPKMKFAVPGKAVIESTSVQVIHDALKEAHDEVKASGEAISGTEVTLEILSNSVPNIDIVDLPGLLAEAQADEPDDLPETVKNIVRPYVSKPGTVVLYIVDGKGSQRNSPAAGLLRSVKPASVIKVFTKVDCLRDDRQSSPLAAFLEVFNKEKDAVALSNYEPKPGATFDEILQEETKFFKSNLPEFEKMRDKIGIGSLLSFVNRVAEKATREQWALKQQEKERKELAKVEAELVAQGPELKIDNLVSHLILGLTGDDAVFEKLIDDAWNACGFVMPQNVVYALPASIEISRFLQKFESLVLGKAARFLQEHASRLHRYRTFGECFSKIFKAKMSERIPFFMTRWHQIRDKIQLDHDTSTNYHPDQWLRGAKCCIMQTILMCLSDCPCGPAPPFLNQQLSTLLQGLPCEESPEAAAIRVGLQDKIKILKEIVAMLPGEGRS
jgi:hypothetical protein